MKITAKELLVDPDRLVRNVRAAASSMDDAIEDVRRHRWQGEPDEDTLHMVDAANAIKSAFVGIMVASTSQASFAGGYMAVYRLLTDILNNPLLPEPVRNLYVNTITLLEKD